jgi:hypothetical protein
VGLRAGLEAVAKKKKSLHCHWRESSLGRPARSLITIPGDMKNSTVVEGLNRTMKTDGNGSVCRVHGGPSSLCNKPASQQNSAPCL